MRGIREFGWGMVFSNPKAPSWGEINATILSSQYNVILSEYAVRWIPVYLRLEFGQAEGNLKSSES